MSGIWEALRCPACGTPPGRGAEACARCGRRFRTESGGLDMLLHDDRAEAERFLAQYAPLRRLEGWADESGVEDPERGPRRMWRHRRRAVARAAAILRAEAGGRPILVADVGAGGGWLARMMPFASVAAVDLAEPPASSGADLRIRADMRRLPFADASLDALVYCASLHYAPVREVAAEAARVLRPGGLLVAVETPVYPDAEAAAAARGRSAGYFESKHAGELAGHYHPPSEPHLRAALASAGLAIERLDPPHARYGALRMMRGASAFPTLVARRAGGRPTS